MNPYVKEQMRILKHQFVISNKNYREVINQIHEECNDCIFLQLELAFNFGVIIGKRKERDLRKWNSSACFHNMHAYANAHNGELPKTQEELKKWVYSHE